MTVLAIETATTVCAAAVVSDGKVRSEFTLSVPQVHSEKLMALIHQALVAAPQRTGTVDGVAVSIGPGSFTGLRIGLSVAKGLAYAWDKPLAAVPTLEALAFGTVRSNINVQNHVILPMIDARRNEVYAAAYRQTRGVLEEAFPARSASVEELVAFVRDNGHILVTGDGSEKFSKTLMRQYPDGFPQIRILAGEQAQCKASAVGLIGERMLLRGEVANLETLDPLYVKDFHTMVKTQHSTVQ